MRLMLSLCGVALALPALAAEPSGTAAAMAHAVCTGKASPEALAAEALRRAHEAAPLNAFITVDDSGALLAARAQEADARHGRCGPLAGVPIVVKDNIEVAGLPSTGGTPALQGYVPRVDAPVVQRLREAGAVIIGKTQMHELAFGVSGWNPAFQTGPEPGVRNAYDPTRIAGGSSSGTAAALGARVVPAGLGTDTGGSLRIPCAFNGCASLRPTAGRYPQQGILPISHTRDTAGPMALAMSDVELLDRVITRAPRAHAARLAGLRLGRVQQLVAGLDADTQQAYDATLQRLANAGVTIVDMDLPRLPELANAVGFPVALYEAFDDVSAYLAGTHTGVTITAMAEQIASPDVKATYQGLVIPRQLPGPDNTLVDAKPAYDAAMQTARPALQKLYRDTFAQHRLDALVFPTVPQVAIAANPESSSLGQFVAMIRNTDPGSNAGLPGVQVPMALGTSSRLPVGLALDGPAGSDRRLLAIGMAIQSLLGQLPPPPR